MTGNVSSSSWSPGPASNGSRPKPGFWAWFLGLFLRLLILVYRSVFSALFPPSCRYTPSCSLYGLEAVQRYGAFGAPSSPSNGSSGATLAIRGVTIPCPRRVHG